MMSNLNSVPLSYESRNIPTLENPVSNSTITPVYRDCVQQHHPTSLQGTIGLFPANQSNFIATTTQYDFYNYCNLNTSVTQSHFAPGTLASNTDTSNAWNCTPNFPINSIAPYPCTSVNEMERDRAVDTADATRIYNKEVDRFLNKIKIDNKEKEQSTPCIKHDSCHCATAKRKKTSSKIKLSKNLKCKSPKSKKEKDISTKRHSKSNAAILNIKKQIELIEDEIKRRKSDLSFKEQQIQSEMSTISNKQSTLKEFTSSNPEQSNLESKQNTLGTKAGNNNIETKTILKSVVNIPNDVNVLKSNSKDSNIKYSSNKPKNTTDQNEVSNLYPIKLKSFAKTNQKETNETYISSKNRKDLYNKKPKNKLSSKHKTVKDNLVITLNLDQEADHPVNKKVTISQHETSGKNEKEIKFTIRISESNASPEPNVRKNENNNNLTDFSFLDEIDVDEIVECLSVSDGQTSSNESKFTRQYNFENSCSYMNDFDINVSSNDVYDIKDKPIDDRIKENLMTVKENFSNEELYSDNTFIKKINTIYDEFKEICQEMNQSTHDIFTLDTSDNEKKIQIDRDLSTHQTEYNESAMSRPTSLIPCLSNTSENNSTENNNELEAITKQDLFMCEETPHLEPNIETAIVNDVKKIEYSEDLEQRAKNLLLSIFQSPTVSKKLETGSEVNTQPLSDSVNQNSNVDQTTSNACENDPKAYVNETFVDEAAEPNNMHVNDLNNNPKSFQNDDVLINCNAAEKHKRTSERDEHEEPAPKKCRLDNDIEPPNDGELKQNKNECIDVPISQPNDDTKSAKDVNPTNKVIVNNNEPEIVQTESNQVCDLTVDDRSTEQPNIDANINDIDDTELHSIEIVSLSSSCNDLLTEECNEYDDFINLTSDSTDAWPEKENQEGEEVIPIEDDETVLDSPETNEQGANTSETEITNPVEHNAAIKEINIPQIAPLKLARDFAQALKLEHKISYHFRCEYEITGIICKGKFSDIYQAKSKENTYLAVKVVRNRNYLEYSMERSKWLKALEVGIPQERYHCLQLLHGLEVTGRWCYVFEYYPKNLEQVLQGSERGIHIQEVQLLARQLVSAVLLLRNQGIIHSDIQPKHILLNATNDFLKLGGFDKCFHQSQKRNVSCIGTVHYRAPEIILGYLISPGIDVWATALVIHEMATNIKLFPGTTNNEVLYEQMCTLGHVSLKMVRESQFKYIHYRGNSFYRNGKFTDEQGHRRRPELIHRFTKSDWLSTSLFQTYKHNWASQRSYHEKQVDFNLLRQLCKLLQLMLVLDPHHRIGIESVYANNFIYDFKQCCVPNVQEFETNIFFKGSDKDLVLYQVL